MFHFNFCLSSDPFASILSLKNFISSGSFQIEIKCSCRLWDEEKSVCHVSLWMEDVKGKVWNAIKWSGVSIPYQHCIFTFLFVFLAVQDAITLEKMLN